MSKRILERGLLILSVLGLGAACNPTVDPAATFTATGRVLNSSGQPLSNAEVRLIKYSSDLNVFQPSAEALFAETPRGDAELGLEVSLVTTARTDSAGRYTMSFKGADIAKAGGVMTAMGLVEVATTVIVVRDPDPANVEKRAGVFTLPYVFQQAAAGWEAGDLRMWAADARADTTRAATVGLVDLSWKKLVATTPTDVKNVYRVDIGTQTGGRFIIRCNQGDDVDGGCAEQVSDTTRLFRSVSAYSLYNYYADPSGMFTAFVEAHGDRYRYVARFTITAPVPNINDSRDKVALEGVWAVGATSDQNLLNTAAVDGNPATRHNINNRAPSIYVKLALATLSDAGLLNTLVNDAAKGCVILEFSTTDYADLAAAKASGASQWTRKGKFCGENGASDEVSALVGFDTTSANGVVAAWMRLRAEPDAGSNGDVFFESVGEVAVLKKKN